MVLSQLPRKKNNTISLKEIETEVGARLLHRINVEFDFPGLEGGSAENLKDVAVYLSVGLSAVAVNHDTDPNLLKSSLYLDFPTPEVGDRLFVQAVTVLFYPDKDVVFYALPRFVKIIE
ncbi:hypothetical protein D9M71_658220 [compost metagenome]